MKKFFISIFIILAVSWVIGFVRFNRLINSYKTDEQIRTDAVIALTGGRNRIGEAVNLINKGLAGKLFISGVQKNITMKQLKKRQDFRIENTNNVFIGKESSNTVENAIETCNWIKKNNIKSIRLVTSNYHVPRSLEEFYSQDEDLNIIVHPVYSENVKKKWWKNWGSFYLIASEYNKYLYVYVTKRLKLRK